MNKTASDYRKTELAQIHIAKKSLGLDDDCYRDVLKCVCGVNSSADLDSKGRFKLIDHFKSLGWKPVSRFKKKSINDPKSKKIWSLWYQLHDAGKLNQPTAKALRTYCKKITGMDDIRFCYDAQKFQLINILKSWLNR